MKNRGTEKNISHTFSVVGGFVGVRLSRIFLLSGERVLSCWGRPVVAVAPKGRAVGITLPPLYLPRNLHIEVEWLPSPAPPTKSRLVTSDYQNTRISLFPPRTVTTKSKIVHGTKTRAQLRKAPARAHQLCERACGVERHFKDLEGSSNLADPLLGASGY